MNKLNNILLVLSLCISNTFINANDWVFLNVMFPNSLIKIKMADEFTGYAIGNYDTGAALLRTFDAGNNWEIKPIPDFEVSDIDISDDNSIYITGRSVSCNCGAIYTSINQGDDWSDSSPITFENSVLITHINAYNNGLAIVNTAEGDLLKTNDGFESVHLIDSEYDILKLSQLTENNKIIAQGVNAQGNNYIVKYDNENWEVLAQLNTYAELSDISVTENYVYVSINGGSFPHYSREAIRIEINNGTLDTLLSLDSEVGEIVGIEFRSENKGYLFTEFGFVYYSNDSGENWYQLKEQIPLSDVHDVYMVTHSYGFACGNEGSILRFGLPANIDKTNNIHQYQAFPNPTDKLVTISLKNDFKGELTILNSIGNKVEHLLIAKPTNRIKVDLSDLPKGIYYVHLEGFKSLKIVKV